MSSSFSASFSPPCSSCCLTVGQLLQQAALVGSGLAAGGALFTSLVISPSRTTLTPTDALKNFQMLFKPSACFIGGISATSSICAAVAYFLDRKNQSLPLAGCAVCMALPIIWTVGIMLGTNKQLLDEKAEEKLNSDRKVELLTKWTLMHHARSLFAMAGLFCAIRSISIKS
eukprot:GHVS01073995.1.p1 GENE.GHVS01073995.1~~GHVS01073995.1.p1  ORF type:complete len:172 (-),score=31.85 GHVS01073995.1:756-1271(-)